MTESQTDLNANHDYFREPLRVGKPDVAGALAVFPVFGPAPRQDYVSFAHGHERRVKVQEREGRASVNELVVENPTELPVLLHEGEEVLGAQQNRIFDISVLVAAGSKLEVPVSCVERGRWESSRHADELTPSRHAAYPELRRMKSSSKTRRIRQLLSAGTEAEADQSAIWSSVGAKSEYHGIQSRSGAMSDIYEGRRAALDEIHNAIRLHPDQAGTIAAIGGHFVVLDYVSRPEVFAELHGPLVQGYALDALEAPETKPPAIEAARGFALLVADCVVARRSASLGLGDEIRIASNGVVGSALAVDGELVQLTAFPGEPERDRPAGTRTSRITRPTRRRR